MDIVNKKLPRGNKFYPVADVFCMPMASLMSRTNIEIIRKARKIIAHCAASSEYWSMCEQTYDWKIEEGTDEYPIISMYSRSFIKTVSCMSSYSSPKKMSFVNSTRFGHINCALTDTIRVRYDPERKGVWMYDVEYEGPLVSNKPMVINKVLKDSVIDAIKLLAVEALIGVGDEDLELSYDIRYGTTVAQKSEILAGLVPKLLSGDYETKDLAAAAYLIGAYGSRYSGNKCILDLDDVRSANVNFTAGARTKLIYHFGGYQLPDDYEEWFDK